MTYPGLSWLLDCTESDWAGLHTCSGISAELDNAIFAAYAYHTVWSYLHYLEFPNNFILTLMSFTCCSTTQLKFWMH